MNYLLMNFKKIVVSNTSLLIVVLGSISSFLLIIFLKKYLPEIFNTYSLYVTYLGIVVSFGYAGFDQVLLRHAKVEKSKIAVGKDILKILSLLLFVIPLLLAYYFYFSFSKLLFFPLLFSGISINLILLAHNLLRLKQKFFVSQIFNSGYKIIFFAGLISLYLLYNTINDDDIITLCSTILIVVAAIAVFFIFNSLAIIEQKTVSLGNYFFSFSLNLGLLTLLTYGERIFIASKLGEDVFGMYFYYSTVFLFPLTLIQYYVGFKELVYFKEKVDKRSIHDKIKKICFVGVVMIIAIFFLVYIDQGFFLDITFKNNILFISLLSVLGLIKLNYGLFSALLGAKGEFKDIYKVNLITFLLILTCVLILFFVKANIELIVFSLIVIFSIRTFFIYRKYVI